MRPLLAPRLYGLALGYGDLHDHQRLRLDPLLAAACEKLDPSGQDRFNPEHRGVALAGASTLNRLELSHNKNTRGHKLSHDPGRIETCLLQRGVRCLPQYAKEIVVDLDAMGPRPHGMQEGRHHRACYGEYCYLPRSVFVGPIPLWAQLRTGDKEGADGVVAALEKILAAIRKRGRRARVIVRGDSGFCREEIMAWCEGQSEVYYGLGPAKNSVLVGRLGPALAHAPIRWCLRGAANVRQFAECACQTGRSWSRFRRVIGQAEVTAQGRNPRFIATNLPARGFQEDEDQTRFAPARLCEELSCARGEMENRLKQQTLDLRADRMSPHYLASHQLRLWLSALAYLLLERRRTLGLAGTPLARATVGGVRLKLLKVAGQVRVSVRRVYVRLSSAYPLQEWFRLCHRRRLRLAPAGG